MAAVLFEIQKDFKWTRISSTAIRVEAGLPGRPDSWIISHDNDQWRVQHEHGEREDLSFESEDAACRYFWKRVSEPMPPLQP
jgi:hypothetical protein